MVGVLQPDLVEAEPAVKAGQVARHGDNHLAEGRVGVEEEGVLEVLRRVLAVVHLVKHNVLRVIQPSNIQSSEYILNKSNVRDRIY